MLPSLVVHAAVGGHWNCLDYLLATRSDILSCEHCRVGALGAALSGGSLACIGLLEEAGCTWNRVGPPGLEAAYKRNPARLDLDPLWNLEQGGFDWRSAMLDALQVDNDYLLSLLYECGLELHSVGLGLDMPHPVSAALDRGSVACLKLAVERSGVPPNFCESLLRGHPVTMLAALAGEDMLRWVLELGFTFHPLTAIICARRGDVGALRMFFEIEPVTITKAAMCEAAVMGNSLECLRLARQLGYREGYLEDWEVRFYSKYSDWNYVEEFPLQWCWVGGQNWDLEMLRYVVQHMDAQWATCMLSKVATSLEGRYSVSSSAADRGTPLIYCGEWHEESDIETREIQWPVLIFLARKLGDQLPKGLAEMAAVRSERVQALAGVIYKAGRLSNGGQPHPSLRTWRAMSRLSADVWERIACEAHIAIPARALPV